MSGGAAAGDYDNDGNIDLYVTRLNEPDILYRNKGDGTFENATAASGLAATDCCNGAAWADIDNDGDLDLYTTSLSNTRFYLFINDGNGQFTEQAFQRGAAIAGTDEHFGYSVTFGDYNGDGYLDIHTTEWRLTSVNPTAAPSNARLLRNRGADAPGYFEDLTVAAGVSLDNVVGYGSGTFSFTSRFADLDDDGYLDLAIAGDFGTSRLFWNNGDGTFTDGTVAAGVGTDENGMGSAIGDYDGDGRLDWFVTSVYDPLNTCETADCMWRYSGNRLYHNDGNRQFSDATDTAGVRDGAWGWGTTFLDYDNDGDLDLVMTNGIDFPNEDIFSLDDPYEHDAMRFWENDGTGVFSEVSDIIGVTDTGSGKGLLTFDYDNDGDLDIFVANNAGQPVLYRNDGGNGNDWLRVSCAGNNPCFGARIELTAILGEDPQVRELNAGSNYLGQNEPVAHFGLNQGQDLVARVSVRWLDGTLQEFTDVPRNTNLLITAPLNLTGGSQTDILFGGAGNDRLDGGGGQDALFGQDGDDVLDGGEGNDQLIGGSGHDILLGGVGDDVLAGGEGNDTLDGGSGSDNLFGEAGEDLLLFSTDPLSGDTDTYDGGLGIDILNLQLTPAQEADADIQAEIADLVEFTIANGDPSTADGPPFTLFTLGLTVRNFELISVNGVLLQGSVVTVYIDPSVGVGGDGSFISPFKSWSEVTWNADRYLQKVGTESTGRVFVPAVGIPNKRVTIGAYGVAENGVGNPIITGGVSFEQASYVSLSGFTIREGNEAAVIIHNGSHHITVENSEIREAQIGVWITDGAGTGNLITGNLIHNNSIDGVAINLVNASADDKSIVSNNVISINGIHGIELNANYYVVEDNEFANNGFNSTGSSGIHLIAETFDQDASNHNIIRYNVVYGTHEILGPDGNGIQLDRHSDFNEVYGNISFDNGGPGMNALRSSNNTFYNNVLFNNMRSDAHAQFARPAEFGLWAFNLDPNGQSENNIVMDNIIVATRANTYCAVIDAPTIFFPQLFQGNRFLQTNGDDFFLWGHDVSLLWGGGESGNDIARWNELVNNGGDDFYGGLDLVEGDGQLIGGPGIDILQGGTLDDNLFGLEGDDILVAQDGNDLLSGGPGIDRMVGGAGDDAYDVDHPDDRIFEFVLGGTDEVRSSVDYFLGNNLENLVLNGNANLKGVGNALSNTIIGNTGNNHLVGLAGDDFMLGGEGVDVLQAGVGNDYLDGGEGNDVIDGGPGIDILVGGPGEDVFGIRRGEDGDAIIDFEGNLALGGDLLILEGFGPGATLTFTGADGIWRIDYVEGTNPASMNITLVGIVALSPVDYRFQ